MAWLAALAFVSLPVAGLVLVWLATRGRLVRCPETGGLGLVEVAGPSCRVRRCDLWPARQGCAQGCLARAPVAALQSPKSSM